MLVCAVRQVLRWDAGEASPSWDAALYLTRPRRNLKPSTSRIAVLANSVAGAGLHAKKLSKPFASALATPRGDAFGSAMKVVISSVECYEKTAEHGCGQM